MPDLSGTTDYWDLVFWGVLSILVTGEAVRLWLKDRFGPSK